MEQNDARISFSTGVILLNEKAFRGGHVLLSKTNTPEENPEENPG